MSNQRILPRADVINFMSGVENSGSCFWKRVRIILMESTFFTSHPLDATLNQTIFPFFYVFEEILSEFLSIQRVKSSERNCVEFLISCLRISLQLLSILLSLLLNFFVIKRSFMRLLNFEKFILWRDEEFLWLFMFYSRIFFLVIW